MSRVGPEGRSFAQISLEDLQKLRQIAEWDRQEFFLKYPRWRNLYAERVLCIALCQGAALHYIHGDVGINDFDVYTFYATHPSKAWYAKRIKPYDFGDPKFGTSSDKPHYIGRRVDVMSRSIPGGPRDDPLRAVQNYLRGGSTATARLLAEKAVILLTPDERLGVVVWPESKMN